jgi:tRNA-splicing endonuclease subunit Sen34
VLVDDQLAHRAPSMQELHDWDDRRIADALQQLARSALAQEDGKKQAAQSEAAIRKRQEREEKRKREAAMKQVAEDAVVKTNVDADISISAPPTVPVAPVESTPASVLKSQTPFTVYISTNSDELQWYDTSTQTYSTLDAAGAAGIWTYPTNDSERARCEVFRDLWEKGYYMGGGMKFGGDWLVYPGMYLFTQPLELFILNQNLSSAIPVLFNLSILIGNLHLSGDPLRYHSHFVASVQNSPTAPLRPMEVVAHGRLGTATKKAHLLCSWDPTTHKVTYFSIEWAGFG